MADKTSGPSGAQQSRNCVLWPRLRNSNTILEQNINPKQIFFFEHTKGLPLGTLEGIV